MKSLGLRCKACGNLFATGILLGVYGRPMIGPANWSCPTCKRPSHYANEDYVALVS